MAWVRVDDKMARGPKIKRAAAALGGKFPRRRVLSVWLEAVSYCNLNATDGFVPDFEVADIEDERPADVFAAMSVGDSTLGAIVERDDTRGGWVFRNYLDYQPSKASLEEKAENDRKRKAEYRASKIRPRVSQECSNGTETDGAEVSATTGPDRTEPDRTGPTPIGVSAETAKPAVSSPPVLTFAVTGKGAKVWALTEAYLADLQRDYEHMDVLAECKRASAWLKANPGRKKTAKGMPTFLVGWLNRGVGKGVLTPAQGFRPAALPAPADDGWYEQCQAQHGGQCNGSAAHRLQMQIDAGRKAVAS